MSTTIKAVLVGGEVEDHALLTDIVKNGGMPSFSLDHLKNITQWEYFDKNISHDIYFIHDDKVNTVEFFPAVERLKVSNPFASVVLISENDNKEIIEIAKSKGISEFLSRRDIKENPVLRIIKNAEEKNIALERAKTANERLLAVEKAASAGIWEWNLYNNSFVWSNEQYRIFGIDPNLNDKIEYDTWRSVIHPDDIESVEADLARVIVGKENFDRKFRIIYMDKSPSGDKKLVRWIKAIGSIQRDENGAAAKMIGINFDITSDVTSWLSLMEKVNELDKIQKEFNDLFDIFFNSSPDCIVQFGITNDNQFFYENVNPAGLMHSGTSLSEVVGKSPKEILGIEIGSIIENKLLTVIETKKPVRYQPRFDFVAGSVIYDAVYTPLFNENKSLRGILACARDITTLHKTEEALRQAQKMEAMGQLASGVAHDFNNVLHTLLTCTQLLGSHVSSELGKKVLNSARKAVGHGEELCSRLINFARPKPANKGETNVNVCIEEMYEIFAGVIGPRIAMEKILAEDIWFVKIDKEKFEIALLNLVINSRDAMQDGGKLTIRTENTKVKVNLERVEMDFVRLSISDTGCGMSKDVLNNATKIFFTTKPNGYGTGLGLNMVANTLESIGGTVTIVSDLGIGTSVILDIPRV